MHASFKYLCISVYHLPVCLLFTIPLSSISLPPIYTSITHLFPYRLSIHRSLAHFPTAYPYIDRLCISAWSHISLSCYLCVCLIITPLHLSAPFWLRCFYLLRLCVSCWALMFTLCPRQQPPDPASPERQPGRLLLARGP